MGPSARALELSDAAGRSAAYSHAARLVVKFFASEAAATAIEYAMVAGGIALVVITAVNQLGQNAYNTFYVKIAGAM